MTENKLDTEATVLSTSGKPIPVGQVTQPLIAMYGKRLKMLEEARQWSDAYVRRAHETLVRVMVTLQRRGEWELAEEVRKALEDTV